MPDEDLLRGPHVSPAYARMNRARGTVSSTTTVPPTRVRGWTGSSGDVTNKREVFSACARMDRSTFAVSLPGRSLNLMRTDGPYWQRTVDAGTVFLPRTRGWTDATTGKRARDVSWCLHRVCADGPEARKMTIVLSKSYPRMRGWTERVREVSRVVPDEPLCIPPPGARGVASRLGADET